MSTTHIVVDLGFGDAGKGTMVDALARRCSTPPLVVRYNGGAQAGHNVHTADGRHHTFSQFGSASFVPGSCTLLSKHFVLHPPGLMKEHEHLASIGASALDWLVIDERALVITPYQQAMNHLREAARGDLRHGTCGLGVGETVSDSLEPGEHVIRAVDLRDSGTLRWKLICARNRKLEQVEALLSKLDPEHKSCGVRGQQGGVEHPVEPHGSLVSLFDPASIDRTAEMYEAIGKRLRIVSAGEVDRQIREAEHVIFEGAQGVLLDEWHGFHPHTTWSTTTTKNAGELIRDAERLGPVNCMGVLRAYATRHGQGPFPTWDTALTQQLRETHNTDDGWQGGFRAGWFDVPLALYALDVCALGGGPRVTELAVTCLDRLSAVPEWSICNAYTVPPAGNRGMFVMEDELDMQNGRAFGLRERPPGDLAYQGQLTLDLLRCTPVLRKVRGDIDSYTRVIEASLGLPVSAVSTGPTAEDKHFFGTKFFRGQAA